MSDLDNSRAVHAIYETLVRIVQVLEHIQETIADLRD